MGSENLIARFWGGRYSGLYWAIDADGRPAQTRKQIYGQAFGIDSLAEALEQDGGLLYEADPSG